MHRTIILAVLLILVGTSVWSTEDTLLLVDLGIVLKTYGHQVEKTVCIPETSWVTDEYKEEYGIITYTFKREIKCCRYDSSVWINDSTIYEIYDNRCGNLILRWNPDKIYLREEQIWNTDSFYLVDSLIIDTTLSYDIYP